ncbi:MAG TPA: hypothetical protein PK591_06315 [Ignavibacteriales bacterium]|nr:hypothetical protein [Ignavibacteriales bacterium]
MIIDLLIEKSFDGYNSKIPIFPECDFWTKTEDEAIQRAIDYIEDNKKVNPKKIKIDRARIEDNTIIYKIIIPDYAAK